MINNQEYFLQLREQELQNRENLQREMYERKQIEERWQLWDLHKALTERKDTTPIESLA